VTPELFPESEATPPGFPATRSDAIAHWRSFLPKTRRYGSQRNKVVPAHTNVSRLSPAIRHRLIFEEEIVRESLDRYAPSTIEKWLQEVCWRGYWKGWLEQRPAIWKQYRVAVDRLHESLDESTQERIAAIESGTGEIAVMNAFARELVETGYLHNHARMWFAGYWIHIEKLPWALGADFFYRHLLDGDPASNTLSWRWVAGLQTRGKTYLPRRSNIDKYLDPSLLDPTGLARLERPTAAEIPDEEPVAKEEPEVLAPAITDNPALLWIHEECVAPETDLIAERDLVAGVVIQPSPAARLSGIQKRRFLQTALEDACDRLAASFRDAKVTLATDEENLADRLATAALSAGVRQVTTPRPFVGPVRDMLSDLEPKLANAGVSLTFLDNEWDQTDRRLATAGFFSYWKKKSRTLPAREKTR